MKALHVITGLGVGGAEQQLQLLLRHLPVDCDVVTLTHPGAVADGLTADGVDVTHLGMAGNRDLAALPRLARLVRSGRYDLVHTHLYRACLYGRLAARLAGVRAVVATEHSLGDSQMEGRPLTRGVRALYLAGERLGRATVAVSPTVAARLTRWGVPASRVEVVPNGIALARFRFDPAARERTRQRLGLPPGAFVVGGIGRLAAGKRFDVLVRALARLPEDHWLVLVGGGPEENVLRRTAHDARVADRVLFTGERPCLPDGSPAPTCRPSSRRWTCSPRRPPRRRSASLWWRAWRPDCPCCTPPAPPWRTCPRTPRPAPGASPAAPTRSPGPSRRPAPGARTRARPRRRPGTTTSPAARPG